MSYKIDNSTVTVTNQRVNQVPVAAAAREERVPGLSAIVSVDPAPRPGRVVVNGYLTATGANANAALSALYALVESYSTMQSDGQDHSVTVANTQYPYCRLAQFNTSQDVQTVAGATPTVRVAAQWMWQRQTTQVQASE